MTRKNLNMKGLDALQKRVAELGRKRVQVGILQAKGAEPKRGPDGRAEKLSVVEIAATHEFGSPAAGIPERSFLRRTFTDHRDDFSKMIVQLSGGIMTGKLTPDRALGLLGLKAETEVKKTITEGDGVPPPLAPATLEKRQRRRALNDTFPGDRPLADTGQLVNSITSAVVDKGSDDAR